MPSFRQILIAFMATTLCKRIFQFCFLAAAASSFYAFLRGWTPTISSIEVLSHNSPFACIFHSLTHWDCPGCGLTRSLLSFFSGSISLSFYFHPLGPVIGLYCCYVFAISWRRGFKFRSVSVYPKKWALSLLCIVISWGVLRNL